jgi:lipopolysaccharide biosynthesis glycosyltransferase
MTDIQTVYVGYDPKEEIAFNVCEYSILKHSPHAEVKALRQSELRQAGIYTRPVDPLSSTEFTFTRFLVPYLSNYTGWVLFCDCDFVWTVDIDHLFKQADDSYAVMVVKHDHNPTSQTKMDGKKQTQYPRKNWSSMILWNCSHPSNEQLTPDLINMESGKFFHRFEWLKDDEIGSIETRFNFLVGWNSEETDGKPYAYHWTEGGPWFKEYANCPYNDVWIKYCVEYAVHLGRSSSLSATPITWVTSLSRSYYDEVANITLPSWKNLPGDVIFVWDDKPIDLSFGKTVMFYKEIVSPEDPWITEGMGGTKTDRFWKKSRVQIWATRKFKGLVVWLDADITVNHPLTRTQAIQMINPGDNVWGTLDIGNDHPQNVDFIDTGIVGFNTRHPSFQNFIRDYSLMWYTGEIFKLHQPYDHYAVQHLSQSWPVTTYCKKWNTWTVHQPDFPNRFAMENSIFKDYFIHHLGIDNKENLRQTNRKEKKKK